MQKKKILLPAIAAVIILLDQLTKYWIITKLNPGEGFSVINGLFNIVHWRNPGAAFGFLATAPQAFRSILLIAVAALAIFIIVQYLRKAQVEDNSLIVALALIIAGAVGNLIDRLQHGGKVTDFIDVGAWPIFNVADSAITVGTIVIACYLLFFYQKT